MENMRLIVTGTVGAGKTTFIRSISEIEVVDTDAIATDETALLKHKTTVAFDFGRLQFSPDMALHLYGTPGQSRFDFMWDILIRKAHAYILLVAAHRPRDFRQARKIMNFMNQRAQIPMIIGLTHTDSPDAWSEEDVFLALGYEDEHQLPPIVKVNPMQRDSVANAVIVLVHHLMQSCVA
ncbi:MULTISPECIES: ATP/GTP-binding protein [unclassified Nodularia (in: cyanobacteria)]|uniref:GTP-binding protein n=1 Tax=unclassified Nodularia (in: cyanobacteria) TaxID=2656917 RepID=UPI00187EF154|nr:MULTISPECIES: ATP/GTP-binding protein [unclassified Nodularia (in: cyanobacteria)]MBE9199104.1 ATP/GTP-binding protein [Nodularia sp. LEGE 06071]MCC2694685.1 ATP/GTP-binding protein [Nodularia sp. LEGE 04288]